MQPCKRYQKKNKEINERANERRLPKARKSDKQKTQLPKNIRERKKGKKNKAKSSITRNETLNETKVYAEHLHVLFELAIWARGYHIWGLCRPQNGIEVTNER